jgi:hypothetical protein
MVKRVVSKDMVAHLWANQSQSDARTGTSNFSFNGTTLFSYETPIAELINTVNGKRVSLVTSDNYSVTTSAQRNIAIRAFSGYTFVVPRLGVSGGRSRYYTGSEFHSHNLAYLVSQYREYADKLTRVRDLENLRCINWLSAPSNLHRLFSEANAYADAFGLATPELDVNVDLETLRRLHAERIARNSTPAKLAAKERAAASRAEKLQREEAARTELAKLSNAEKLARWRNGEAVSLPWEVSQAGALLRIRGELLETSQGANVPLSHAIRVFFAARQCRETATQWVRNGHTIRVGSFQVDQINTDGSFRAGCHYIQWAEIEAAARIAGVFDAPATTSEVAS